MATTDIQALRARQQFSELLEGVYSRSRQYRITRRHQPVARLVGEPFMQAVERLLAANPGLADTLALMLNDEARQAVEQGMADARAGRKRSAREFFDAV
jgi:antitoxin (DNA-binding transcriptional repressor) of toxin-antitoxin stability system